MFVILRQTYISNTGFDWLYIFSLPTTKANIHLHFCDTRIERIRYLNHQIPCCILSLCEVVIGKILVFVILFGVNSLIFANQFHNIRNSQLFSFVQFRDSIACYVFSEHRKQRTSNDFASEYSLRPFPRVSGINRAWNSLAY